MDRVKKALVIGSGPIVIGQAAEFDYAGTQACKALREEGVISILVNSNPATIMTDEGIADIVYIEPLTVEFLERIIAKERPDGIIATLGGQTGLNLAVELAEAGILDKYGVRLLGTPIDAIRKAEDRALFRQVMLDIGEPVPESQTANTLDEAKEIVKKIGLPVVIRPAYTLGGTGGGIAHNMDEFERIVSTGLHYSPIHQVLVEKSIEGWKEIEYEVMRDGADNCITVCNMENIDPMGVHTGESIVVAPSQTLTDKEYQMLRSASIKIIRRLGIEGACNIQFALPPHPIVAQKWYPRSPEAPYYVIEVNPRASRSSALASKATGYPIARVAAKIAVGKRLDEITNRVTGKTTAAFEPALDYCVVKIPRWPFDKFPLGERKIGTQMKSTGEAAAIDRCFEAALQKAIRSLEFGNRSLLWEDRNWGPDWKSFPLYPNDLRLWAIMAALRRGATPEELSQITGIDPWFMDKFKNIIDMERRLLSEPLTPQLLWQAKRLGFSDEVIGTLADRLPEQVRQLRKLWGIKPVYKMVDTCAAEFEATTPYFYSTYEQENEALPLEGKKAVIIGAGPIRIGQGIEFDYGSVHAVWALQKEGIKAIMINNNPETVSTDFDTSDRLYFDPLDEESVRDILENEDNPPVIVQFGGQTAINLAEPLDKAMHSILGSDVEAIDLAEDRRRFEDFLNRLGIPRPPGAGVSSVKEALEIASVIGYPVLVRPSYVLGGRAMEIVYSPKELERYVKDALEMDSRHPVLIDKYLQGREVEIDAVCDGEDVIIPGIMEHIERAGVHSGDSIAIYPPQNLSPAEIETIINYSIRIGQALKIKGLMNIQFVVMPTRDVSVYVLEVNPRSSRTVPFISKATGVPLVYLAIQVMLGRSLKELGYRSGLYPERNLVAIKAPVFSMSKLAGVDSYLGPEMKSTGEVMGIDFAFEPALTKSLLAAGLMLPRKGAILVSIADRDKSEALPIIKKLAQLGYELYATEGTAAMIEREGLKVNTVKKISQGYPNAVDLIRSGKVDGVINTLTQGRNPLRDGFHIRRAAAERRIPCFTSLDTAREVVNSLLNATSAFGVERLSDYLTNKASDKAVKGPYSF